MLVKSLRCLLPYHNQKIVRIEASSNYSKIIFDDAKPLLASKPLAYFEQLMPEGMFVRVHRRHLVNREQLKAMQPFNNGIQVLLYNNDVITVSRRMKKHLMNSMQSF